MLLIKIKMVMMKISMIAMITMLMKMMMTNFLHPGILTPFSFIREHQTPLLPAPDNKQN